jgi:ATP-binding cassette, subfamily B, bacterial
MVLFSLVEGAISIMYKLLHKKQNNTGREQEKYFSIYKWMLSFIKPYKKYLVVLITCELMIAFTNLINPKVVQYLIDVTLLKGSINKFYILLSIVILLFILVNIIIVPYKNILQRNLQESVSKDLQLSVVKHLRKLGIPFFESTPHGEILSLLNTETKAIQEFYSRLFPLFLKDILFAVMSLSFMACINIYLTLTLIPPLLIYSLIGRRIERKASLAGKSLSEKRLLLNQKIYSSINSITELKTNNAENWDLLRFRNRQMDFNNEMVKLYFYAFLRGSIRRLTYYAGAILLIIYGFYLLQNALINVGAFVAFLLYYFFVMQRLTVVITSITEQKVLISQAQSLYKFFKQSPYTEEIKNDLKLDSIRGDITFKSVYFSYDNKHEILKDINLDIKSGERVALIGESGGGKSTIFKLLTKCYDPNQGTIYIDNVPLNRIHVSDLRESIGYVFQETYLFGSSVFENIRFGMPNATLDEVIKASKAANAHDFIMQLPYGYHTLLGERGVKLSGGQKQRISIARMFIKDPKIVLLDEATSSLDNITELEIYSALTDLLKGRTTIAIAHRLSSIKDYDKIFIMKEGKIINSCTYQELISEDEFTASDIGMSMRGLV